jgi:hypothetical protein
VHVHLQRRDRRPRRVGSPQDIDEAIPRHDCVRVQQQDGEKRALLRRSQRERPIVADGRDRSQNAEFDCSSSPFPNRTPSGS